MAVDKNGKSIKVGNTVRTIWSESERYNIVMIEGEFMKLKNLKTGYYFPFIKGDEVIKSRIK